MFNASSDDKAPGHSDAKRIVEREHFKVVYSRKPGDLELNLEPGKTIFEELKYRYGEEHVRLDFRDSENSSVEFPVIMRDDSIQSSLNISNVLNNIPAVNYEYVFISPEHYDDVVKLLEKEKANILKTK